MLNQTINLYSNYVDIHPGQRLLVIRNNEVIATFSYEELLEIIKQTKNRQYKLSEVGRMNKKLSLMIRGIVSGKWTSGRAISISRTTQNLYDYIKSLNPRQKSNINEQNIDNLIKLKRHLSPKEFAELRIALGS